MAVALSAPAKVNLALHVTGRRADGYHLLDSIAVFTDLADRVTIAPAEALSLEVSGRFAGHAPGDRTDLAWRAAEAFFRRAGLPARARIHVEKNIPAGAGLGGGSADAAAVLAGLNELTGAGASAADQAEIGLALGADVPMCLKGSALRARGIGEQLDALRGWPRLPLLLVWPGRPVATAACFKGLADPNRAPLASPPAGPTVDELALWLAEGRNDLEEPATRLEAAIGDVLAELRAVPGCRLARMSGSGSACFGLFGTSAEATAAGAKIGAARPHWWVAATEAC